MKTTTVRRVGWTGMTWRMRQRKVCTRPATSPSLTVQCVVYFPTHTHTHTHTADKERDQLRFEEEREERRRPPKSPKKRARPVARDRPTAHKSNDRPACCSQEQGRQTYWSYVRAVLGRTRTMIITCAPLYCCHGNSCKFFHLLL